MSPLARAQLVAYLFHLIDDEFCEKRNVVYIYGHMFWHMLSAYAAGRSVGRSVAEAWPLVSCSCLSGCFRGSCAVCIIMVSSFIRADIFLQQSIVTWCDDAK